MGNPFWHRNLRQNHQPAAQPNAGPATSANSRAAYQDMRDTGRLGKQQQTILGKVQAGRDYSLRELAALSGLEINAVSGRVNDLKKLNLLVEGEKRACTVTGKTITPVKLPAKQGELFQ